jgi:hypothetical protein
MQLVPEECAREIFPLLKKPGFRCVYRFLIDGDIEADQPCRILPMIGGLYAEARDVPPNALIQLEISFEDRSWTSSFEGVDALRINMVRG